MRAQNALDQTALVEGNAGGDGIVGGVKLVTHLLPLRPVEGRPDRKSCRQLGRPLLGLSPNLEVANTEDHAATSASTLQPP